MSRRFFRCPSDHLKPIYTDVFFFCPCAPTVFCRLTPCCVGEASARSLGGLSFIVDASGVAG